MSETLLLAAVIIVLTISFLIAIVLHQARAIYEARTYAEELGEPEEEILPLQVLPPAGNTWAYGITLPTPPTSESSA